jgi:hypothetical protein
MIVISTESIVDTAVIAMRSLNNTTISVTRVIVSLTVKALVDRRGSAAKGRSAATHIHDWTGHLSF